VVIHRAGRLGELLAALRAGAGDVEVVPVAARAGRAAGRVLVRARKGRKGDLTLWPSLTLHEGSAHAGDGESYTAVAQKLLRGMAELSPGG
jgi:tRNA1(Val) A37 N6-methylase TrmN6